jgi:hypothetical protein
MQSNHITKFESITDWRDYSVVSGVYFWGNRELGPMIGTIDNMQNCDIIEVTESDK